MAPDRKQRLKLVVSTLLVTLWGVGAIEEWPVLGGALPLVLVFLIDSQAAVADRAGFRASDLMQPRLIPLFALLFIGVFYLAAKYGFPGIGLGHAWRGWLVIPLCAVLLAHLVLQPAPEPAGDGQPASDSVD